MRHIVIFNTAFLFGTNIEKAKEKEYLNQLII